MIWIFTDKLGKICAVAKGAKKGKSKYLSITLPFCYGEYVVFKGKNLYTLNEGKITESFQQLLNDLTSLTYASYLCELIDICVQDEESNRELFQVVITTLYLLKTGVMDNDILMRAFELKLLKHTGYGLNFEYCSICRSKISTSNFIDFQFSGGVCDNCNKLNGIYISKAAFNSLKFLNNVALDKVYRLTLSKEVKDELYRVISVLISNNYSKKPKSLQMFDFIKECELNE